MSFDESTPPRSAKRRKIAQHSTRARTETTPRSGTPKSIFQSLGDAVNGISAHFFDPPVESSHKTYGKSRSNVPQVLQDSTAEAVNEPPSQSEDELAMGMSSSAIKKRTTARQQPLRGMPRKIQSEQDELASIDVDEDGPEDGTDGANGDSGTRSSGRQRRRPRRLSNDLEEAVKSRRRSAKATPAKSTMPTKQTPRSSKRREEVGISDTKTITIGEDFGFKDIEKSAKKRKASINKTTSTKRVNATLDEQLDDGDLAQHIPGPKPGKGKKRTGQAAATEEVDTREADHAFDGPVDAMDVVFVDVPDVPELQIARDTTYDDSTADVTNLDDETQAAWSSIQEIVISKITGRRRMPLIGLDEEYRKIYHVAEQTVIAGEGNSMLILGPRGSGKTATVEDAISTLAKDHQEDFHVVRLNGFLQTDDRLALREIWRQLGREMEVEDDTSKISSYADTMASLLALLSHPEELSGVETDTTTKSIIFIIDEFDLFATHPRQTLLYNLFDIAQARKAPIAVFGLSTKVDVAEHLEKRVKSRFSHRYVYLPLARSLPIFTEMCKSALVVHDSEIGSVANKHLWSAQKTWNSHIQSHLSSPALTIHLRHHFTLSKSLPTLLSTFLLPLSQSPLTPTNLSTLIPVPTTTISPPDSLLTSLPLLPTLHLSLLIASSRLEILLGTPLCNFNMTYHEYVNLCSKSRLQASALGSAASGSATKIWGREVCVGVWEELAELGFLVPVSGDGGGKGVEEGREERMFRVDVRFEEIEGVVGDGLGSVLRGWCREL